MTNKTTSCDVMMQYTSVLDVRPSFIQVFVASDDPEVARQAQLLCPDLEVVDMSRAVATSDESQFISNLDFDRSILSQCSGVTSDCWWILLDLVSFCPLPFPHSYISSRVPFMLLCFPLLFLLVSFSFITIIKTFTIITNTYTDHGLQHPPPSSFSPTFPSIIVLPIVSTDSCCC